MPNRIRSLDGLRAFAISLVLVSHLTHVLPSDGAFRSLQHLGTLGELGVRIFFVISGFLITTLLLQELRKTNDISLRKFYFRRTLRIFPAFYVFVAAMGVAAVIGWISVTSSDILAALTYTMNYHSERSWYLGHAWSLSVEEQFYCLWPFTLRQLGVRRGLSIAAGVVMVAPLIRVGISVLFPSARPTIGETFFTIADAMAVGCLLAGYRERLLSMPWYVALLASRRFWAVPVLVFAIHGVPYSLPSWLIGQTLENFGIALCIHTFIDVREGFAVRLLNCAPVAFVGVLSYSLYLWQQPFMQYRSEWLVTHFPFNFIAIALAALGSYYLVERPWLRLRVRLEERHRTTTHVRERASESEAAAV